MKQLIKRKKIPESSSRDTSEGEMHHEVQSDKPGSHSKCGMALEKQ